MPASNLLRSRVPYVVARWLTDDPPQHQDSVLLSEYGEELVGQHAGRRFQNEAPEPLYVVVERDLDYRSGHFGHVASVHHVPEEACTTALQMQHDFWMRDNPSHDVPDWSELKLPKPPSHSWLEEHHMDLEQFTLPGEPDVTLGVYRPHEGVLAPSSLNDCELVEPLPRDQFDEALGESRIATSGDFIVAPDRQVYEVVQDSLVVSALQMDNPAERHRQEFRL